MFISLQDHPLLLLVLQLEVQLLIKHELFRVAEILGNQLPKELPIQ